jgi:pilus assembly protein CpaB
MGACWAKELGTMKNARLVTLAIAGFCGGVAIFLMKGLQPAAPTNKGLTIEPTIVSTKVLVAKKDIGLGETVGQDAFRWQEWPEAAVSPAFVTDAKRPKALMEFDKRIARVPVLQGEPITDSKLIKFGEGGVMSSILPAGMRAISTRIREETAAGKLILPNDYVDVILIQRKQGKGGSEHVADTLFRNVRVLAIGQTIETKEGKKSADGGTATLELTPRQSELLALANSMGELTLALRSIADINAPGGGTQKDQSRGSNSIRVLRYGVKSRAYGVN